jgi:hypothetical protein
VENRQIRGRSLQILGADGDNAGDGSSRHESKSAGSTMRNGDMKKSG